MKHLLFAIIILLAASGMGAYASSPSAAQCVGAEDELCVDLVEAEITFKRVGALTMIKECGSRDSMACASLNLTTGECTIYHNYSHNRIPEKVRVHEMNHCHGWTHANDSRKAYDAEWHPIHPSLY